MNSRMCGAGMLIVSSVVIALGHAVSAYAAAPRVIMFYGGVLSRPIILDDWSENFSFMVTTDKPITMPEKELKDRLSIEVAFFWGQKWVQYIEEGKPLDQLDPKEAEQHGRYYPETKEGVTAVIVMDRLPYFLANQTRQRQISSEGIEILKKHKMRYSATAAA